MSQAKFEKAASVISALPEGGPVTPTQDEQLELYGYYKQATVGDINTTRPGMFDMKGKAKWDVWKKQEGVSTEKAREEYVKVVIRILTDTKNASKEADDGVKAIEAA